MSVCECVLQCNTVGGIVVCASYALVSSRARCTEKAKVLGGWEVTQAFFSIAKTLLSILPPIWSSVQTDVWARIARKMHHTIIYWEYNIGWESNEMLPEGCLGCAGILRHMKEKYCVYTLCTVYFLHSQDVCSGSEAPLLMRELRHTVRAIFHLFFHLLSATSSSFQERNINWAWLHLSELLCVSC